MYEVHTLYKGNCHITSSYEQLQAVNVLCTCHMPIDVFTELAAGLSQKTYAWKIVMLAMVYQISFSITGLEVSMKRILYLHHADFFH